MPGKFRIAAKIKPNQQAWGLQRWVSNPPSTDAKEFAVVEAILEPGEGHSFHKHPGQEEVLYVVSGKVEQWIDLEKQILGAGDAVFVPADIVHASFNVGKDDAKVLAIFGPCVGPEGIGYVEVAGEAPWKGLRT